MVALLAARFFQVEHDTEVRHVFCEEHGELTDLTLAAGASSAAAPGDRWTVDETRSLPPHVHCELGFAEGSLPHPRPPLLKVALPPEPRPVAAPRVVLPPRERSVVLALAPKTSPPPVL